MNKKIDLIETYGVWIGVRLPVPFFKQIESLPEEKRKILQSITSDDLKNIRKDAIWYT